MKGITECKSQVRHNRHCTALLKPAKGCEFEITLNEILRNRLVFGIWDNKAKATLKLADTDEICLAAESMVAQVKVVDKLNAIKLGQKQ